MQIYLEDYMSELTNIENGKVKLSLKIPAEDYRRALESAYRRTGAHYNIPGFRKGKVPRKVIEATYGVNVFWDEEFDSLVQSVYSDALAEHNLVPEIQPNIEFTEVSEQDGVSFTAEVVLHPTVKLGQYKGIEAPVIEYNVTDEEVSAEIQKKLNEMATEAAVEDRPVRQGDIVTLDFAGFMGDEQFEGGTAEGYKLKIGSGSFIPGFEEQMVGMNIGEEKDLNVTFPTEYHAKELAGKEAVFHVKVNGITETQLPALDDDFAKDISEFDTLDAYKADVRAKLEAQAAERDNNVFTNAVIGKVMENATVEIPEAMIERQIDSMIRNFEARLAQQGLKLADFMKYTGQDEKSFRGQYRDQAEKSVRANLVLEAIENVENFEVSDEEIDAEIEKFAKQIGQSVEELKKNLTEGDREYFKADVIRDKAVKFLCDNAKAE